MKKKRLFNRVGCAIIAILMALSLGLSPVASQVVRAEGEGADTGNVPAITIVSTQKEDALTFEKGKECNVASYFTVYYNGVEPYLIYDGETGLYHYSNVNAGSGYHIFSELFEVSYYKINGENEELLFEAPKSPGTYKAYAEFAGNDYYVYENDDYVSLDISKVEKGVISFTITGEEDPEITEGLQLVYGNKELRDEDALILLMFGDGFQQEEQSKFYNYAQTTANYIMDTSPWDEFTDTVKIYAYGTVSEDSGARGEDAETASQVADDNRNTYFGTSFWTGGGMQRLLAVGSEGAQKVEALKEQFCPQADYSVIIVNSQTYGGSGGDLCVASMEKTALEIMVHELGHTVGGLSDEYWPGKSYAIEGEYYPNLTTESDSSKVPWARFVGKNGIGVYEHDTKGETETKWYRPSQNCKMQYLGQQYPFCEVCKEALRKALCKGSKVTKLFFQTYADEFYQPVTDDVPGVDMSQYFILRKGNEEITGDKLGEALTLIYKNTETEETQNTPPSEAGTYTITASYDGSKSLSSTACSLEATYTIELPDLITFDGVKSKVYDGSPVQPQNIEVEGFEDGEYDIEIRYTGTTLDNATYDDTTSSPIKPGSYTVTVTAISKDGGKALSRKSKNYDISIWTHAIADNNDSTSYPGATDLWNNQDIVIVGDGFTAEEQDKFEALAEKYVNYIQNTEPFKETKLYFNFYEAKAISEANANYFRTSVNDEGKIVTDKATASLVGNISYTLTGGYYDASIVIVNDNSIKEGTVEILGTKPYERAYIYVGVGEDEEDEDDMAFAAREILNHLTNHEVGYDASAEEDANAAIAAQRMELLDAMFSTWYGEDYAIVVSRAYDEIFIEGETPDDLSDYFHTYIYGKEVPSSELKYEFTYYDSEGTSLGNVFPSEAGTYSVLAELNPTEDGVYASDYYGETFWKVGSDENIRESDRAILDDDGNEIGWLFDDLVTEVKLDGISHYIPRARGESTFRIVESVEDAIEKTQQYLLAAKDALDEDNLDLDKAKEYLEEAQKLMEDGALADTKNSEVRQAMEKALEEAQQQVAEALKQSEDNQEAAEAALKKAEAALKEAEAAKKEAEAAKNEAAKAKFQVKKTSIKSIKRPKKKTIKVTWKKVSGADGYEIQYSKKSNFKSSKTVKVSGTAKTIKKLTSKKKYYVRVRAYKVIGGKTVYTKWSTKKSVVVK